MFLLLNNTFLKFQLNWLINVSVLDGNASLATSLSQVAVEFQTGSWLLTLHSSSIRARVEATMGDVDADQA